MEAGREAGEDESWDQSDDGGSGSPSGSSSGSRKGLRTIFTSSRSEAAERAYSRMAFFNLVGFVATCAAFTMIAQNVPGAVKR